MYASMGIQPHHLYTSADENLIMDSPLLSFRVDEVLVEQLDQLSAATDHDRQDHLSRALIRYLEPESRHLNAIAEGIADAEAGNLTDLQTIKAKWANRANGRMQEN